MFFFGERFKESPEMAGCGLVFIQIGSFKISAAQPAAVG